MYAVWLFPQQPNEEEKKKKKSRLLDVEKNNNNNLEFGPQGACCRTVLRFGSGKTVKVTCILIPPLDSELKLEFCEPGASSDEQECLLAVLPCLVACLRESTGTEVRCWCGVEVVVSISSSVVLFLACHGIIYIMSLSGTRTELL